MIYNRYSTRRGTKLVCAWCEEYDPRMIEVLMPYDDPFRSRWLCSACKAEFDEEQRHERPQQHSS